MLISGGTGFIGKALKSIVPGARYIVRVNNNSNFEDAFFIDDFNGVTKWDGAFEDIETVVHLAGVAHLREREVTEYNSVNVLGTLNFANAATNAGVKRFVFVSSIGVNGTSTCEFPFTYESLPCPHNPYAISKYEAELGLKKIAEETGLEVVIVRPTLVYGPLAPGNFGMLTNLVGKLSILPFGLANNRRDFIAVQNLADLLLTCAVHPDAAGHTFLASDGETVSIKQFTNAIAEGLGKKIIQLPVPVSLMRLAGKITGKRTMIEQLYGNLEVDSSNIKEVLGWTPPLTIKQAMAALRYTGQK